MRTRSARRYPTDNSLPVGSPEFFAHIRPWMNPSSFHGSWSALSARRPCSKALTCFEIGCGMGFDSLEFLKREVRVTATDLTPRAVDLARRHLRNRERAR